MGGSSSSNNGGGIEAPNTQISDSLLKVLHVLGEGPMRGFTQTAGSFGSDPLTATYINDVQFRNADGSYNFNVSGQGFQFAYTLGGSTQQAISGFANVSVNVPLPPDTRLSNPPLNAGLPKTLLVTFNTQQYPDANSVIINFRVPQLYIVNTSNGDTNGFEVDVSIDCSLNGGAFQSLSNGNLVFNGKNTTPYFRTYQYTLPLTTPAQSFYQWTLRFQKTSQDVLSTSVADDIYVDSISVISASQYNYPNTVLAGLFVDALQFGTVPSVAYLMDGLLVSVPSGYTPTQYTPGLIITQACTVGIPSGNQNVGFVNQTASVLNGLYTGILVSGAGISSGSVVDAIYSPAFGDVNYGFHLNGTVSQTYTGNVTFINPTYPTRTATAATYPNVWNGTFTTGVWTNNPAWIFYDFVTNPRYGLGQYINTNNVDIWTLYQLSQYCDQMVDNGQGTNTLEPQFTINAFIKDAEDAYSMLLNLSAAFRGMLYYGNGTIRANTTDNQSPVFNYTNANVINGVFNYSSTARAARHNAIQVKYTDPNNLYRDNYIKIEDPVGITQYGYNEKQISTFGCTSLGQATRLGNWILTTERLRTETVSFQVGLDSLYLRPGDVFNLYDNFRMNRAQGGRVTAFDSTQQFITLDRKVNLDSGCIYALACLVPTFNYDATGDLTGSNQIPQIRNPQIQTCMVLNSNLSGLSTLQVSGGFSGLSKNAVWVLSATGVYTQGYVPTVFEQAPQYECLAINQSSAGIFDVVALNYNTGIYYTVNTGFTTIMNPVNLGSSLSVAPATSFTGQYITGALNNGSYYSYLNLTWQVSPSPNIAYYSLSGDAGMTSYEQIGTTASTGFQYFSPVTGNVDFTICAVSKGGVYSPHQSFSFDFPQVETVDPAQIRFYILPFDFGNLYQMAILYNRPDPSVTNSNIFYATGIGAPFNQVFNQTFYPALGVSPGYISPSGTTIYFNSDSYDVDSTLISQEAINQSQNSLLLLVDNELMSIGTVTGYSYGTFTRQVFFGSGSIDGEIFPQNVPSLYNGIVPGTLVSGSGIAPGTWITGIDITGNIPQRVGFSQPCTGTAESSPFSTLFFTPPEFAFSVTRGAYNTFAVGHSGNVSGWAFFSADVNSFTDPSLSAVINITGGYYDSGVATRQFLIQNNTATLQGQYDLEITTVLPDCYPDSPPSTVNTSSTNAGVILSWSPPIEGIDIDYYNIYIVPGGLNPPIPTVIGNTTNSYFNIVGNNAPAPGLLKSYFITTVATNGFETFWEYGGGPLGIPGSTGYVWGNYPANLFTVLGAFSSTGFAGVSTLNGTSGTVFLTSEVPYITINTSGVGSNTGAVMINITGLATSMALQSTGQQLYSDITGLSGWAIATFTGGGGGNTGTGFATAANLQATGSQLYSDTVGLSGWAKNTFAAAGGTGAGNVIGPVGGVTNGDIVIWNGTGGFSIADGGYSPLGLIGSNLNAAFGLLTAEFVATFGVVTYPGGGTIQLRFDLGNLAFISCGTSTLNLSPSGSIGMVAGRWQHIIITNTSGGIVTVTTNSSWTVAGTIPSTLSAGQTIALYFEIFGTSESNISVAVFNAATSTGLPSGGAQYQRMAKNSALNYDVGWYTDAYIYAQDYGVNSGASDNTANLVSAVNAAIAANATVILPPGILTCLSAPTFSSVSGTLGIKGCGKKVTRIQFSGATNGLSFDCSTGTLANNAVNLANFGILSNNSGCQTGLIISYGTTSFNPIEDRSLSSVENVEILGGGWLNGFNFTTCWHLSTKNLYAYGNSTTYTAGSGAGSGAACIINGGVNQTHEGVTHEWWAHGFEFDCPFTGGAPQGIQITTYQGVEILSYLFSGTGLSGQTAEGLQVTNFLFDNGNEPVTAHAPVSLLNFNNVVFSGGWIGQNGGTNCLYFDSCNNVTIGDIQIEPGGGGASPLTITNGINFDGTCQKATVSGLLFNNLIPTAPIIAGASTGGIRAQGNIYNGGTNSDSGSGNFIGEDVGFTATITLTGGSATETHYLDITQCYLGKKADGAPVQVTNNQAIGCQYNWDNGSNTATKAYVQFFNWAGGNLPAFSIRITAKVGPGEGSSLT